MDDRNFASQKRLLAVWTVRTVLCAALLLAGAFALRPALFGLAAALGLLAVLLPAGAAVYLPPYCKSYEIYLRGGAIVCKSGVFAPRTRAAKLSCAAGAAITKTPLLSLFSLCGLRILFPGGSMSLWGLRAPEGRRILELLCAREEPPDTGDGA